MYDSAAAIIIILAVWLLLKTGVRRYAKRQRTEKELENKSLQNEQLEEELRSKKNELVAQASSLLRKNNTIKALLSELEKQKDALGDRFPSKMYSRMKSIIDEAFNDKSDRILFDSYFNSAHQDFIKQFSLQYTDITPGDIRLCCLLRMNLSTKEIASLLHISIRAIELRRYRLRKKIELDNDKNLVEFLMNF